ncbi:origin recognition complex subunit 1 [Leptopilina heterotoma]|uniref:origin recognition complex subunit 1 n=1 Tax=Leptopilina heterotoma TaxID=63436 RepID=UPI001CAA1964|nr:origin recognition complex subunit 1 [Leptopilina heterotoma]
MAPTTRRSNKNSKRGGKKSQTNARKQKETKRRNVSTEEQDVSEDEIDEYVAQAMDNPLKLKLCIKVDHDKLESTVQKFMNSENSDDEGIIDAKPKSPMKNSPDHLSRSMKNLDISNKKTTNTRKSQKDLKTAPARITRNSTAPQIKNESETPSRARSARKTLNSEENLMSSGRNLRDRKTVDYCDGEEDSTSRSRSVSKKRNGTRESNENDLCETPKKRAMRTRMSTREPLNSVDENQTLTNERTTPKNARKVSTRTRKSIIQTEDLNQGTPSSVSEWKNTSKTKNSTPVRKKLLPEKIINGTPKSRVGTPKSRVATPKLRSTLTPSTQTRNSTVSKPKTNLQEFRTRLHVSFVPKSLPCREAEFNDIFTFLKGKLTEEIGGCIYISGVPGTGKTATVNEVISCLKKLESKGELSPFEFVDINGMKLTEPRQAYVQIKKKLTGSISTWEESHRYLHHRFTTPAPRRNMTLLLIDEMDLLCTKRQEVVYNLLDWPTHKASHLVVITIANTMDLPERVLMSRVTSRLGLTRLTFSPYNHIQLMEIVKTRLKDMEGFKPAAIQLVARKVASVSGDARRALDICRRATEIAEGSNREFVTILDVTSALNEMIANPRVQAIKCCSVMEKIFLEAVCQEVSRTGIEQVTLKNVYLQFESICLLEGEGVPNITQTLEICRKLASWRLILWESGADLYQSILLNVTANDIYFSKKKTS